MGAEGSRFTEPAGTRYFVLDEEALLYWRPGMTGYGVLAGNPYRAGPNPTSLPLSVGPRDATIADFERFRVSPVGHLVHDDATDRNPNLGMF